MSKQSDKRKPGFANEIMKQLRSLGDDIWVVLLDIVAVNASYFLILILRYYVAGQLHGGAEKHMGTFLGFAPIYTLLCVLVFVLFRLYNGVWRYAGINDMNRIIAASLVTAIIQPLGTWLIMGHQMPGTYYVGGAMIQFFLVTIIRFCTRFVSIEQKKIASRKLPAVNVMIVGTGEAAMKAIRQLEDSVYQAACIVDSRSSSDGKTLNGIPVLGGTGRIERAVGEYAVSAVVIADPNLSSESREQIKQLCQAMGLDLQDYTGLLMNLSGRLPLSALLESVIGPVSIRLDGQTTHYDSGMDALASFNDRYTVSAVCAEGGFVRIDLKQNRTEAYAGYEAWLQKHKEETGEDVSYF